MDTVRLWIFGFFAAAILLLLLHLWIASGIAALKELRPKWKTIALPQFSPTLQNLLKKPKLLKRTGTAQQILFHALFPCLLPVDLIRFSGFPCRTGLQTLALQRFY